jgi:hypothetical protein
MTADLPVDLASAQLQALQAAQQAIADGYRRLEIEILVPDLKPEPLALPFLAITDPPLTAIFSDAGGAALAQREWGSQPEGISLQALGASCRVSKEMTLLFVTPSVYSLESVEALSSQVSEKGFSERPIILLNPQLQDAAAVGVGLSGRRIRQRFITTFEPVYALIPLASGAVFRVYPDPWGIWQEDESGEFRLLEQRDRRPTGEELDEIFAQANPQPSRFWDGLRRFFKSLQDR